LEKLVQSTITDSDGKFYFGGVPQGTYEIVVDAVSPPSLSSSPSVTLPKFSPTAATITTGVEVPSAASSYLVIPLVPTDQPFAVGVVAGVFSTTGGSLQGATITYAAVQPLMGPGGIPAWLALIPEFLFLGPGQAPNGPPGLGLTSPTAPGVTCGGYLFSLPSTCPSGSACACYSLSLPLGDPATGAANPSGSGYVVSAGSANLYAIEATASLGSNADCNPSTMFTAYLVLAPSGAVGSMIAFTGGPTIAFTGCQ
jgi:hypothetical protein